MPARQGPRSTFSVAKWLREVWRYWRQPHTDTRSYPNYQVVTERAETPKSPEDQALGAMRVFAWLQTGGGILSWLGCFAIPFTFLALILWGKVAAVFVGLACLVLVAVIMDCARKVLR